MKRFEQIESYLQRQMPPEEVRAFEAEIAADPELAALVQQHRLERQGLELLVERDLLARMQAWDRETDLFQQAQPRRAVLRPMAWALRAAAILALAAFGYWLLQRNNTAVVDEPPPVVHTKPEIKPRAPTLRRPSPAPPRQAAPAEEPSGDMAGQGPAPAEPAPIEEIPATAPDYAALADAFFQQRDFVPLKGSKGGASGSAAYNQALDKFQDGKYQDVISKLRPLLSLDPDAVQQKELMALSLYQSGQYEEAILLFRDVISSRKQPYAQRAEWALALTLLHQMPAKKPLFDRVLAGMLSNPQHPFYTRAKQLEARLTGH
ncbi:MAG: tetratricopeptide repeat protein [Saprospirales bacterium]|nr:tetratricopeptide repeat protein [Saprospirales bacterium]